MHVARMARGEVRTRFQWGNLRKRDDLEEHELGLMHSDICDENFNSNNKIQTAIIGIKKYLCYFPCPFNILYTLFVLTVHNLSLHCVCVICVSLITSNSSSHFLEGSLHIV